MKNETTKVRIRMKDFHLVNIDKRLIDKYIEIFGQQDFRQLLIRAVQVQTGIKIQKKEDVINASNILEEFFFYSSITEFFIEYLRKKILSTTIDIETKKQIKKRATETINKNTEENKDKDTQTINQKTEKVTTNSAIDNIENSSTDITRTNTSNEDDIDSINLDDYL